jgi:hypothetical protein
MRPQPFSLHVPDSDIADLHQRLAGTRLGVAAIAGGQADPSGRLALHGKCAIPSFC